jgi:hypothetical protein
MDATKHHSLAEPWTIWSHLSQASNPSWTLVSDYIQVATVDSVESVVGVIASIPSDVLENSHWFTMRHNVLPMYEDPHNINGGYFSYKVHSKDVKHVWSQLNYCLVSGQLAKDPAILRSITGVSISSKKKFCIIKIWLSTTQYQDPKTITDHHIAGLNMNGGMFGLHPIA